MGGYRDLLNEKVRCQALGTYGILSPHVREAGSDNKRSGFCSVDGVTVLEI